MVKVNLTIKLVHTKKFFDFGVKNAKKLGILIVNKFRKTPPITIIETAKDIPIIETDWYLFTCLTILQYWVLHDNWGAGNGRGGPWLSF